MSELPFASVSKRVLVQSLSYGDEFYLLVNEPMFGLQVVVRQVAFFSLINGPWVEGKGRVRRGHLREISNNSSACG